MVDNNMEDLRLSEVSSLSDPQEKILSMLSILSGTMSAMCSSLIVYQVVSSPNKTPYKRIMLGLSVCDIVASLTYAYACFLLPQATSQRVWARGNDSTCTLLGFLAQFSFSAIWYNGLLSFYYLATIRLGVRTRRFAQKYEPFVHIAAIGYNLVTAAVGVFFGLYSEAELGQLCWIAEYPENCEVNGNCTGTMIGWVFAGLPTVFMFIAIIVNNIMLYRHVKRTVNRTRRRSMAHNASSHQEKRIQAVATQAFLYVGTFFCAYSWAFIVKVLESMGVQASDEASVFPLLVLHAFFLPLQGVFNLAVYTRPNYLRIRDQFPEQTKFWAVRQAWFREHLKSDRKSIDATLASKLRSSETGVATNSRASQSRQWPATQQQAIQISESMVSSTTKYKQPQALDFLETHYVDDTKSSDGGGSSSSSSNNSCRGSDCSQTANTAEAKEENNQQNGEQVSTNSSNSNDEIHNLNNNTMDRSDPASTEDLTPGSEDRR